MVMRQDASTGKLVDDGTQKPTTNQAFTETLQVKIWSPFRIYFKGEAKSLSGVNSTGPFDILAQHRNFITLLSACELTLRTLEGEVKIRISGGVLQVHKNMVTVFLEV